MMKEKLTINDVLNELGFTTSQKDGFVECVKTVKQEQKDGTINAEFIMRDIIKEVCENENQ